jgi:hypothetical protein
MKRWLRCLVFVVTFSVFYPDAQAQPTAVLIVVQGGGSSDLNACEQRLRSELLAEGYQPTTVQVTSEPNASVLVDTAKRLSSPAAIAVSIRDNTVSGLVWMVAPKKSGGLLRAVTAYPLNEQAPAIFAISATDVLHGGLLELGYVQETSKTVATASSPTLSPNDFVSPASSSTTTSGSDETTNESTATTDTVPNKTIAVPPATATVDSVIPTTAHDDGSKAKDHGRKHVWQLSLGADAGIALSDMPIAFIPHLTFTRRLARNFALGLSGHVALPVTLDGKRGKADVNQIMVGPWLEYRQTLNARLSLFEFFETGFYYVTVHGRASPPLRTFDSYASTVYQQAGAGINWSTTTDFVLWLNAGFFVPWQSRKVIIVDETVTKIATPTVLLGAGMAMRF